MYAHRIETRLSFDEAVAKVTDLLGKEGFGIISRINLDEKLKEKLGRENVRLGRYVILGACNPPFAYRALQAEPDIGVLLPCNVIVREDDGRTVVAAINPLVSMKAAGNPALEPLGEEINARLRKVMEGIG